MKKLYWAGLLVAAIALVSWRSTESFDDEVEAVMSKHQAIGLSVVVVKNNKICYHHSYGYSLDFDDPTARKPIQANGIYWIASVSKTFISTAIMQLVEKKMLKFDDDVGQMSGKCIISKKSEVAMWQPKGSDRNYGYAFSRYPNI